MRKILLSLLLMSLYGCANIPGIWGYDRQFDYALTNGKKVHQSKYVDIEVTDFSIANLKINFKNKTNQTLRLVMDESIFTNPNGETHRLLSGIATRGSAAVLQPPIVLPRKATLNKGLYFNNSNPTYTQYGTIHNYQPVMEGFGRVPASINGQKFSLLLTFKDSNDKRFEEYLEFTVTNTKIYKSNNQKRKDGKKKSGPY